MTISAPSTLNTLWLLGDRKLGRKEPNLLLSETTKTHMLRYQSRHIFSRLLPLYDATRTQ
jgi:hypothetical protein